MNKQEIESFALQYHNIKCVKLKGFSDLQTPFDALYFIKYTGAPIQYLELRSIESLTKEEKKTLMHEEDLGGNRDYCRKIGIAVCFRDYSVDYMIERGIVNLKS